MACETLMGDVEPENVVIIVPTNILVQLERHVEKNTYTSEKTHSYYLKPCQRLETGSCIAWRHTSSRNLDS